MIKQCYYCTHAQKPVDWKDIQTLRKFTSTQGRILAPRVTGACSKHQRKIARAIKRARVMSLMPFTIQAV
ncbi:MAG: 30S ribosomal protein S18 [Candidatus Spechtbacteria bacterium]|nr:30S ribosomal protein S18 [Candidatus Spechtbacteria bacterium]